MSMNSMPEDESFRRRLQSLIDTAAAWDSDVELLRECRDSLPWEELRDCTGKYSRAEEDFYRFSHKRCSDNWLFVQRLTRYFRDVMTWIDKPACSDCGTAEHQQHKETRGAVTAEEVAGKASRVEVYSCQKCAQQEDEDDDDTSAAATTTTTTTFPRYNSVRKLFQTKAGRCGEYANLFGLYCRAVGLPARYVWDASDHVWIEVWLPDNNNNEDSGGSWIMCDGCEGVIHEPSMYEAGWGKKNLSYQIAAAADHVVDVTARYTRQYMRADFQTRRRQVTSSEAASEQILSEVNNALFQSNPSKLSKKALQDLRHRVDAERSALRICQQRTEWEQGTSYDQGRISGSLAWKVARSEAGRDKKTNNKNKEDEEKSETTTPKAEEGRPQFAVETFLVPPAPPATSGDRQSSLSIEVVARPAVVLRNRYHGGGGIVVNGTAAAALVAPPPYTLSVAILDDVRTGFILQSRAVSTARQLYDFVSTVPDHRIVAMHGYLSSATDTDGSDSSENNDSGTMTVQIQRQLKSLLGGFQPDLLFRSKESPPAAAASAAAAAKDDQEQNVDKRQCDKRSSCGLVYIGQVRAHPDWAYCAAITTTTEAAAAAAGAAKDCECKETGENYDDSQGMGCYRIEFEEGMRDNSHDSGGVSSSSSSSSPYDGGIAVVRLKTLRGVQPAAVCCRLPETVMTLQAQLSATYREKRTAYETYVKEKLQLSCSGYTTKRGSPVYLLGASAYPLQQVEHAKAGHVTSDGFDKESSCSKDAWNTFLWLPAPMVSDDDDRDARILEEEEEQEQQTGAGKNKDGTAAAATPSSPPTYQVPVDVNFFTNQLGPHLLASAGSPPAETGQALENARLVGLYFSAHWCPPCKAFTPMLAELYAHLKEDVYPSHGLEIVFVSSDRDETTFRQYYGTMPWLAVPFQSQQFQRIKSQLSAQYHVTGIPCLIILDAVSGQVVVPASSARSHVMQACHAGEDAIESMVRHWFDRLPSDTKDLMDMLQLSTADDAAYNDDDNNKNNKESTGGNNAYPEQHEQENNDDHPYLVRSDPLPWSSLQQEQQPQQQQPPPPPTAKPLSREEMAAAIKAKFTQLQEEGMAPNEAAAKAIALVSSSSSTQSSSSPSSPSPSPPAAAAAASTSENGNDDDDTTTKLDPGPLNGKAKITITKYPSPSSLSPAAVVKHEKDWQNWLTNLLWSSSSSWKDNHHGEDVYDDVQSVLSTVNKYLDNAVREPWTWKFRTMRFSNKVCDTGITRHGIGAAVLTALGLDVYGTSEDYFAALPLAASLEQMKSDVRTLLQLLQQSSVKEEEDKEE